MSEELKPCPFCGRQMRLHDDRRYRHGFQRRGLLCAAEHLAIWADDAVAIAAWNRRTPMTALTTPPAGEEGERVKARLDGLLQGGDITPYAFDEICMWLDRLSSPRVEEVRREAFEEAAKVADEMAGNRDRVSGVAAHACRSIASLIRSLSPQGG